MVMASFKRDYTHEHRRSNKAVEPTPYSVRSAPASGRGSPRALDAKGNNDGHQDNFCCFPIVDFLAIFR
jgi:hypothetical protein